MVNFLKNRNFVYLLTSICLSYLYLFDTTSDWDHFISALHVDGLGFIENLSPIKWSYLLCGGVSRIGDPQSFSYSPLIIFPILFGGFWGSKILVMFSSLMGSIFLDKLTTLISPKLNQKPLAIFTIVFSIIYSNYFLAHITEGHLTFILLYFAFGIVYYAFLIFLSDSKSWKDLLLLSFLTYLVFSSGFYAVTIYFSIPCLLAAIISVFFNLKLAFKNIKSLLIVCFFILIGLSPALPKIFGVIDYQNTFPRKLSLMTESNSIESLIYYLTPVYNYLYLGFYQSSTHWGNWEKTAFSIIFIILFISIYQNTKSKRYLQSNLDFQMNKKRLIITFSKALLTIGFVLSLGDFIPHAPYTFLKEILNNSIRVPFRFSISALFAIFILTSYLIQNVKLNTKVYIILLLFIFTNSIAFLKDKYFYRFKEYTNKYTLSVGHYKTLTFVPKRNRITSSMYPALNMGIGVYNCYMPLKRSINLSGEFNYKKDYTLKKIPFIYTKVSRECLENSYFSQEKITLDKSCPKEVCLNFNGANIHDKTINYTINKNHKRLCIKQDKY